jgi:predicted enzyme related to lactoylglutathione lyase
MKNSIRASRDVIVRTDTWAEAIHFYGSVLGLPVTYQSESLMGFEAGAFCLYVEKGEPHGPVFEFLVPDVQTARQRLVAVGCVVQEEDASVPRCYLRDPYGFVFNIGPLPNLVDVQMELERREPVFHRPEFGTTRRAFEEMTDASFWEIGASGRRYTREDVLDTLVQRYSQPHEDVWETREFSCTHLSADTFMLTYTLVQDSSRTTRRTSIWRKQGNEWKILYHQGTLVDAANREGT